MPDTDGDKDRERRLAETGSRRGRSDRHSVVFPAHGPVLSTLQTSMSSEPFALIGGSLLELEAESHDYTSRQRLERRTSHACVTGLCGFPGKVKRPAGCSSDGDLEIIGGDDRVG